MLGTFLKFNNFLEKLRLGSDGTILIFLSDKSNFEYDNNMKEWKKISSEIDIPT